MGVRRHVPHEPLDLYLRQRLPRGAHGPGARTRAGLLQYGAHLVDKKDARRVEKAAATLTPEEWQNHGTKKKVVHVNKTARP